MILVGYADTLAAGGQVAFDYSGGEFTWTSGISAVYVEQQNIFEGQYHRNTDDYVFRFWDDGRKAMPTIGWEGHDEGDMSPNAATSAGSSINEDNWMPVEEVAQLFNTSTDEFTPDKFKQAYEDTWIKSHLSQAKIQTNTAEAGQEIIEQVQNETDSADETTAPAATGTAETPITTEQVYGTLVSSTTAPAPGYNVDGTSAFTNFVNAFNNKQFFILVTGRIVFEKPGTEPISAPLLMWCSDLTFSDFSNSSLMGYAARCVGTRLAGVEFSYTIGVSAVFSEQQNIFEGQYHSNTNHWVHRYWDSGRKTMPTIGWRGHDKGDMSANAATSLLSSINEDNWMSVEEVAQLFNTTADEFTPDKFKQAYEDTWIKGHEDEEAATDNPYSDAEQEIIEEVKNETDSTGEITTTTPAEPDTEEDGGSGTNTATPIEDDGSAGNGRKLTSVAARFVSAALRVFVI